MTASKGRRSLRRLFRSFGELSPDFVGRGSDLLAGSVLGSVSEIVFIFVFYGLPKSFRSPSQCELSPLDSYRTIAQRSYCDGTKVLSPRHILLILQILLES